MSVNLNALKQYQNVDLRATAETASPHKLIEMLIDGALGAMAKAKGAIERGVVEDRTRHFNKANEIIVGLRGSLDFEKGGEVAANLESLYDYMNRTLLLANRENSAEKVQEVMNLLLQIKQGWSGMPDEHKN
ncbi:flagellar export chaperone FliS [Pontibacterium granulatum]|uniref:flagellar export chaperone FliS n=1 Tax=Pontibacterium granulatum TaxID=2036029 RepID=UPI00249AE137|nr:flagellar export chaperone FliS [Pontibacterium granulatum]MDI3322906.1 flagellar export chaperone FliS [Pontibacterium granulatum]